MGTYGAAEGGGAHRERVYQLALAVAHQRVAQEMPGIGLPCGDTHLQGAVGAWGEAQGIALLLGLGKRESVFLTPVACLHLGAALRRGEEEAAHTAVLGREGYLGTCGIGQRLYRHALSVTPGSLEGDTVLDSCDEVPALGQEVDVEFLEPFCLGALDA